MTATIESPSFNDEDEGGPEEAYEIPRDPEARSAFRLINDRMAAWAMRKLWKHTLRRRMIVADADEEIERWQQWKARQTAAVDGDIRFFEGLLTHYLLTVRADKEDGRKSVDTPYGRVTSKATQPKWVIDEVQVLAWARENRPALVKTTTTEKFSLTAAKELLGVVGDAAVDEESGALVPGITVIPGGVSASITLDLGGSQ